MSTTFGALRRRLLAPTLTSVSFRERGFPAAAGPVTEHLETVPHAVVCGFEWAIDTPLAWDVERRLGMVEPALRGFAYEGAAMAYTILDRMSMRGGTRARDFLLGPGRPHIFLTYIGIGFAMARLPRVLWKYVLPDLTGSPYYPTMSWFAVDGYGFDRAYFDTKRWVEEQRVPKAYPWQGHPDYFLRACDQGVGRALWFIHGAEPGRVAAAVRRFAEQRHADLWSGVGLAATFAGGCDERGFAALRATAGEYAPDVGLGAVLACKGRSYASYVPSYTETGVAVLTGISAAAAIDVADRTEVTADTAHPEPAYELWRQRIRAALDTGLRNDEVAAES